MRNKMINSAISLIDHGHQQYKVNELMSDEHTAYDLQQLCSELNLDEAEVESRLSNALTRAIGHQFLCGRPLPRTTRNHLTNGLYGNYFAPDAKLSDFFAEATHFVLNVSKRS